MLQKEHRNARVDRLQLDSHLLPSLRVFPQPQLSKSPIGDFLAHQVTISHQEFRRRSPRLVDCQAQKFPNGENFSPILLGDVTNVRGLFATFALFRCAFVIFVFLLLAFFDFDDDSH